MSLRYKFIISLLSLTLPVVFLGGVSFYLLNKIAVPLKEDIPQQVQQLATSSALGEKALLIRYYDEVLTQSARNYAFTGETRWKMRYQEEAPKLDVIIKEAIIQGDEADKKMFSDINGANIALVAMEEESMALVDTGDLKPAVTILDSEEYARQKQIYQEGLVDYAARRGTDLDKAVLASTQTLETNTKNTESLITTSIIWIGGIIVFSFLCSFVLAFFLGNSLSQPLIILKNQAKRIAQGMYSERLPVNSRDELGQLSETFNNMTEEVKKSKEGIEQKVKERTVELEKLNAYMTDRELTMIELKKSLKQAEEELAILKKS